MQTTTILFIVLALLISVSVSYFQYFYKTKTKTKINILLFFLKTISLFLLLLLLINPIIKNTELENIKPTLSFLVDNSKSISYFEENINLKEFKTRLSSNIQLQDKFSVEAYTFGENLGILDSLVFNENNTNISQGILELNKLNKNKNTAIVLLTDGNQTIGNDYEYVNSKHKIFPVVFGDTTKYNDLKVTQVNVNKYSYIKNKFPVEVILNYDGDESVNSRFSIFSGGKTVFSKNIEFSKQETSKIITANLTSTKEGVNYYTASIQKIKDEKNTRNNTKNFSVEVIDEQSKVLILTAILHPDIGALKKAIESNKQRSVTVQNINEYNNQLNDYQLIILYQPNNTFNSLFSELKKQNTNFLLFSGAKTDWNIINKQQLGFSKKFINQTENYGAIYNDGFLTFLQKDIGFNQFQPLTDTFGEISFTKEHQNLLFQNINGLQTTQPLLSVLDQNDMKIGIIFGEGIWKWRASSFLMNNNFQEFDQFIGNFAQFISSKKKRNRLEINSENIYPANSAINITAFYTDKNYNFDARASLEISITNKTTKEVIKLPFSLVNNSYQTNLENLSSGDYSFKVTVLGQNITRYSSFKITDYIVEEQFTNANNQKLQVLANKTGGKLYYKTQMNSLLKDLINDKSFFTTQKSIVKEKKLIDFKWLLFFIVFFFTTEWFVRKYFGKI